MWQRVYVTTAEASVERLWAAAAAAYAGPAWRAWPGGGSAGRARLEECAAPRRLTYTSRLPLARWIARFEFDPAGLGTRVRISVRLSGPLSFLWRRLLREAQADWLSDLGGRLVREALAVEPGKPVPNPPASRAGGLATLTSLRGVS